MRYNIEVCRVGTRFAFTVNGQLALPTYATYDEAETAALDEAYCLLSAARSERSARYYGQRTKSGAGGAVH